MKRDITITLQFSEREGPGRDNNPKWYSRSNLENILRQRLEWQGDIRDLQLQAVTVTEVTTPYEVKR